jgi:hypothetical protein
VALDFVEDRNRTVKFDRKSLAMIRGKDYMGDLARIQKDFLTIGKKKNSGKLLRSIHK